MTLLMEDMSALHVHVVSVFEIDDTDRVRHVPIDSGSGYAADIVAIVVVDSLAQWGLDLGVFKGGSVARAVHATLILGLRVEVQDVGRVFPTAGGVVSATAAPRRWELPLARWILRSRAIFSNEGRFDGMRSQHVWMTSTR